MARLVSARLKVDLLHGCRMMVFVGNVCRIGNGWPGTRKLATTDRFPKTEAPAVCRSDLLRHPDRHENEEPDPSAQKRPCSRFGGRNECADAGVQARPIRNNKRCDLAREKGQFSIRSGVRCGYARTVQIFRRTCRTVEDDRRKPKQGGRRACFDQTKLHRRQMKTN